MRPYHHRLKGGDDAKGGSGAFADDSLATGSRKTRARGEEVVPSSKLDILGWGQRHLVRCV